MSLLTRRWEAGDLAAEDGREAAHEASDFHASYERACVVDVEAPAPQRASSVGTGMLRLVISFSTLTVQRTRSSSMGSSSHRIASPEAGDSTPRGLARNTVRVALAADPPPRYERSPVCSLVDGYELRSR